MSAPTVAPGTRVKIKRNESFVKPGRTGTVAYLHPATRMPVVSVEPEGRPVSFSLDELEVIAVNREEPPMPPTSERYGWDILDPREEYVNFTKTGLTISSGAACHFAKAAFVEVLIDRAAGALGIHPCGEDAPLRVRLLRSRYGASIRLPRLVGLLRPWSGRGTYPRHDAWWDAATTTLIIDGVAFVEKDGAKCAV